MVSRKTIHLYRSPDFISLSEAWLKNYRAHLKEDPLTIETVIVHSQAMARYLNQVLTQELGVAANIEYILPQSWENQIRKIFLNPTINHREGGVCYNNNPYDPQYLRWVIYNILTHPHYLPSLKQFPILKIYLFTKDMEDPREESVHSLKAYQLSEIMAKLFNDYLLFREEMLWEWDNHLSHPQSNTNNSSSGELNSRNWQKWLWQTLRQHLNHPHRLEELAQIKKAIKNNLETTSLPSRISVFGISYLPLYYLELLNNLKEVITIDYYFPDITRPWNGLAERPPFFEKLGELSDAYLESIERMNWKDVSLPPKTPPGKPGGFLPFIKSFFSNSKFNLSDKLQNNIDLQIHHCPNRRREVEVVKNQILTLLENDSEPNITLDKVLILAPDILVYQDYLESVFSCDPALPFNIIDRNENHTNTIIKALFTILELLDSEWELSQVRHVLTLEVVQLAQSWNMEDLAYLEKWIDMLGIVRGRGKSNQEEKNSLPHQDLEKFTWQDGIRRAMLNFALPSEEMAEISLHGDRAQVLGKMVYLIQKLLIHDREFQKIAHFTEWLQRIHSLVSLLYPRDRQYLFPADIQKDYARFNQLIRNLEERVTIASSFIKLDTPNQTELGDDLRKMNLNTFIEVLKKNLGEGEHSRGNSHHGITCGSLLPLRIIPSTVTFIMGMARDEFPRHDHQKHFNLILENPRPGDRTQKKGDYLLMIETLFATRNYLGVTFCSAPDTQSTSPSTLVDELISLIKSRSHVDLSKKIISHPLLPSLPPLSDKANPGNRESQYHYSRYSYDPEDYKSMVAREQQKQTRQIYSSPILPELKSINTLLEALKTSTPSSGFDKNNPEIEKSDHIKQMIKNLTCEKSEIIIKWEELISFFIDAPKFFLKNRLGMDLNVYSEKEDDEEPFMLKPLNKYQVVASLVKQGRKRISDITDIIPPSAINQNPNYPPGIPGENQRELLIRPLHRFHKNFTAVMKLLGGGELLPSEPLIIETYLYSQNSSNIHPVLGNIKIESFIRDYQTIGDTLHHILYRHTQINVHDIFRGWLNHLLLHTTVEKVVTWLIGEEIFFFPPLKPIKKKGKTGESLNHKLLPYVLIYAAGQSRPLPIYRDISKTFHEKKIKAVKSIEEEEFSLNPVNIDRKSDQKIIFRDNDLIPDTTQVYAHYLWGERDENEVSEDRFKEEGATSFTDGRASPHTEALSDIYHHLWDDPYHFLTRLNL